MDHKKIIDNVEKLLDFENSTTKTNYFSWDKGDCSPIGIVRILMIQTIEEEITERGEYYDGCYDKLLKFLNEEYTL